MSESPQPQPFRDRLRAMRDRARDHVKSWKRPEWTQGHHLARIPKVALIIPSAILGALLVGWVVLNFTLADPRFGTPAVNWALRTFGDKSAGVETAKLEKPFSSKFVMRGLDWPTRATAKEMDVTLDYFGWLPGHPWAGLVRVRDGEITLPSSKNKPQRTFNVQKLLNRIDAGNVLIKFTRRGKLKQVTIISATG